MNTIKINGETFILPDEKNTVKSVLNHIDMVKKGIKTHVNLFDVNGEKTRFCTFELNTFLVEVDVKNLTLN